VKELQSKQIVTQGGEVNAALFEGADMVLVPDSTARQLFQSGQLRDLSAVRLPQLNDGVALLYDDLSKVDGKRVGLPFSVSPSLLTINPDQLAKAGVSPPVDWTVQEFEQALNALKAAGVNYDLQLSFLWEPMVRAFGGQVYDPAKQAWAFDSPEARQGLAYLGRLTQSQLIKAETEGKAMIIIGKGPQAPALTALPSGAGISLPGMTMMPFPKGPRGRSVPVSAVVGSVLARSAHPEAATDFLRQMISSPAAQAALARGGIRPVTADAAALAAWAEAVGDKTAQATDLSLQGAYVPASADIRPLLTGLVPFWNGQATLDQLLPSLMATLQH
jgi:ABC-type glycerol-3-phosphate transport system substrate-binding protein